MDAKDLRIESAPSEHNDGNNYSHNASVLQCDQNNSYQDIGSNSLVKVDAQAARPCAVIGPDRVVRQPTAHEPQLKKAQVEPWPIQDNNYRRPPDYPSWKSTYHLPNPTRNISPRQTFQENMQRILVPPTYNNIKSDDPNFPNVSDRNNSFSSHVKLHLPSEGKFYDVPYNFNPLSNEQKNARSEISVSNVNSTIPRAVTHGWPSSNLRPPQYGAPELYQYSEYANSISSRPLPRPHRTVGEDPSYVYADSYYQDPNARFKPYPSVKERYPQARYEYINNYPIAFHPQPQYPTHKYDIQKSIATAPHPYPHPTKYLDGRVSDPLTDGYQRTINPQINYNIAYHNQVIHQKYGPMLGNCFQNKLQQFPPEGSVKSVSPSKVQFDNNRIYVDYENTRNKTFTACDSLVVNDVPRINSMRSHGVVLPNYPRNIQAFPPNPYHRKDTVMNKNYDYVTQLRHMDPSINNTRHSLPFSPNGLAISPTESNTSSENIHNHGTSPEDCGYVSQSSTTSIRSTDSGVNRMPGHFYRRYDYRYGSVVRGSPHNKSDSNFNSNISSKENKNINVRQFLQMWNEGDDETIESNSSKEIVLQTNSSKSSNLSEQHKVVNDQEQLYVLGFVNVPNNELSKYEHIQKVSKLPENIKGYNNIELLNQFEEAIESSNLKNFKTLTPREYSGHISKPPRQAIDIARPLSPLDVEAKISQSVIHKEVGCNFEIKPCSPKMLNVEIPAPVCTVLSERIIEKVANSQSVKTPVLYNDSLENCNIRLSESIKVPSCKMVNTQFANDHSIDSIKSDYSIHDLESNSGVCLASLPRLDNDIELNFPEVNQQFINANKGDAETSCYKDSTPIESMDQKYEANLKERHLSLIESNTKISVPEVEKDFPKLSKYRKIKLSNIDTRIETLSPSNTIIRTDSVIIENPDKIKHLDEQTKININQSERHEDTKLQVTPINLTSQANPHDSENNDKFTISDETKNVNSDSAIDFSLQKTDDFNLHNHNNNFSAETTLVKSNEISEEVVIKIESTLSEKNTICPVDIHASKNKLIKNPTVTNLNFDFQNQITKIESDSTVDKSLSIYINDNENRNSNINEYNTEWSKEKTLKEHCRESKVSTATATHIINDKNASNYKNDKDNLDTQQESKNTLQIKKCNETNESYENPNSLFLQPLSENVLIIDKKLKTSKSYSELLNNTHSVDTSIKPRYQDFIDDSRHPEYSVPQICSYQESICVTKPDIQCKNKSDLNTDNNQLTEFIYSNNTDLVSSSLSNKLSKELHSPWIQKLLTYSEGVCCSRNIVLQQIEQKYTNSPLSANIKINETSEMISENYSDKLNNLSVSFEEHIESMNQEVKLIADYKGIKNREEKIKIFKKTNLKSEIYSTNSLSGLNDKNKILNSATDESDHAITDNLKENNNLMLEKKQEMPCSENIKKITESVDNIRTYIKETNMKYNKVENEIGIDVEKNLLGDENSGDTRQSMNFSPEVVTNLTTSDEKQRSNAKEDKVLNSEKNVTNDPTNSIEFNHEYSGSNVLNSEMLSNISANQECTPNRLNLEMNARNSGIDNTSMEIKKLAVVENLKCLEAKKSKSSDIPCGSNFSLELLKNYNDDSTSDINSENGFEEILRCTANKEVDNEKKYEINDESVDLSKANYQTINCATDTLGTEKDSFSNEKDTSDNEKDIFDNEIDIFDNEKDTFDNEKDTFDNEKECDYICEIKIQDSISDIKNSVVKDNSDKIIPGEIANIHFSSLKRSLSDSAITSYTGAKRNEENFALVLPFKRRKYEEEIASENLCNIIQTHRRNSICSSIYNEQDVSFCILIDNNCIITEDEEDTEEGKICFTEIGEDCFNDLHNASSDEKVTEEPQHTLEESVNSERNEEKSEEYKDLCCVTKYSSEPKKSEIAVDSEEKWNENLWCRDIGFIETVMDDDIAEDIVISAPTSPKDSDLSDNDESEILRSVIEHTDQLKFIYGDKMCGDDAQLVDTLYRTPQMDVNKTLLRERDSHISGEKYYDTEALEKILSESNTEDLSFNTTYNFEICSGSKNNKENVDLRNLSPLKVMENCITVDSAENHESNDLIKPYLNINYKKTQEDIINSCESSIDNVFSYKNKQENSNNSTTSSSPEVSSTTSEENNASILLKISNYKGSRVSQINQNISDNNNTPIIYSKVQEEKDFIKSYSVSPKRPLITKAAQKYIPPIKESLGDLKVKLSLPTDSLLKLKQLKISKDAPKLNKNKINIPANPKKPKPKFEDVLKSIDDIQIKMHKEKNKKIRKLVPKVVIKKNENGSHYASTPNKNSYNPDLTGRKWQPWVFLEKNDFVDKMAIKRKIKAIYSHRKNTYVLAENFHKYKSASATKFVIAHPKIDNLAPGHLKCTIKLKHSY